MGDSGLEAVAAERELVIESDGLALRAGMVTPARPWAAAVLLHGIPSSAPPDPADTGYAGFAGSLADRGLASIWVDMRAAHSSPGYFSIAGWVRDATAAIAAARRMEGAERLPLVVVGSSAGGAVAVEAAARGAVVDFLVLLGSPADWISFASGAGDALRRITEDAAMTVAPDDAAHPERWAAEFDDVIPERSIARVSVPALLIHGTEDDVVPVGHARRIADHAAHAHVELIEGGGHRLRSHPSTIALMIDWLRDQLR